jgi:hypothetical protein
VFDPSSIRIRLPCDGWIAGLEVPLATNGLGVSSRGSVPQRLVAAIPLAGRGNASRGNSGAPSQAHRTLESRCNGDLYQWIRPPRARGEFHRSWVVRALPCRYYPRPDGLAQFQHTRTEMPVWVNRRSGAGGAIDALVRPDSGRRFETVRLGKWSEALMSRLRANAGQPMP